MRAVEHKCLGIPKFVDHKEGCSYALMHCASCGRSWEQKFEAFWTLPQLLLAMEVGDGKKTAK